MSLVNECVAADYHIALCANGTILPGLHATLSSLTNNLTQRERVSITLFFLEIDEASLASLRKTVADAGGVGALRFEKANVSDFRMLASLHGDWMTYMKLCLPNLLPEAELILYLDSDLIVTTDVCAFFAYDLGSSPLGAIGGGVVEYCLDHAFLKTVGLANADRAFNAGVLLLNARLWRTFNLTERAISFGKEHAAHLPSHDQTILNALFSKEFYSLPEQFNIQIFPETKCLMPANGIYHFVGSPKPWDALGRLVHPNWHLWHTVIKETRFTWSDFLPKFFSSYTSRTWMLRRSYLRTLKRRYVL